MNHRHGDFQSPALPTELPRHGESGYIENHLEAISAIHTVVRNTNMIALSTLWWTILDLNQGPIGYEPIALTTELMVRIYRAGWDLNLTNLRSMIGAPTTELPLYIYCAAQPALEGGLPLEFLVFHL